MEESRFVKIRHEIHGDCVIFILTLCHGLNKFSKESIREFNRALDHVIEECANIPRRYANVKRAALVTTGQGKFYSAGGFETDDPKGLFLDHLMPLYGRLICFPLITVAALNGHCFGSGMVFAMAHDFRVMRSDRGYMCMPEIELPTAIPMLPHPLPDGFIAIVKNKTASANAARDLFINAQRLTADEALEVGLIDKSCSSPECLREAASMAVEAGRKIEAMPLVASSKRTFFLHPTTEALIKTTSSTSLVKSEI